MTHSSHTLHHHHIFSPERQSVRRLTKKVNVLREYTFTLCAKLHPLSESLADVPSLSHHSATPSLHITLSHYSFTPYCCHTYPPHHTTLPLISTPSHHNVTPIYPPLHIKLHYFPFYFPSTTNNFPLPHSRLSPLHTSLANINHSHPF